MQESLTFMMVWSFCRIMMFKNVIWVTFTLVTAISVVVGSHPIQLTLKKTTFIETIYICTLVLYHSKRKKMITKEMDEKYEW